MDKEAEKRLRDTPMRTGELLMYTADGHSVSLRDWYRGKKVFLVMNGPSLLKHDLEQLRRRGILTMGVNNGWLAWRPDLWLSVDDPQSFADVGWKDPGITKFVPLGKLDDFLRYRTPDGKWVRSGFRVRDMPACWFFRRNTQFNPQTYLSENTINWGQNSAAKEGATRCALGLHGGRSVMLAALRLLYYLGLSKVYLLGVDFRMVDDAQNYAFSQHRWKSSVRGNNSSYKQLNERLAAVWPLMQEGGMAVVNCTPNSGLKVFPTMGYQAAVDEAAAECEKPTDPAGWYEPGNRWDEKGQPKKENRGKPDRIPGRPGRERRGVKRVVGPDRRRAMGGRGRSARRRI